MSGEAHKCIPSICSLLEVIPIKTRPIKKKNQAFWCWPIHYHRVKDTVGTRSIQMDQERLGKFCKQEKREIPEKIVGVDKFFKDGEGPEDT